MYVNAAPAPVEPDEPEDEIVEEPGIIDLKGWLPIDWQL